MSNATGPQSLSRLLADVPAIRRLICDARSKAATQANPQIGESAELASTPALDLPPAVAAHTQIQLLPDRLILLASNNSVAQLLRFHAPRLAKAAGVADFQVRVQPELFVGGVKKAPSKPKSVVPQGAVEPLQQAANAIDHEPLSDALRRLANLAEK
ncbi:MAG: hypothetical protein P1U67_09685 [Alcanivoracaceae bacterium]|nr:hypothetical protein [Alcanivoracaceae bacterium]